MSGATTPRSKHRAKRSTTNLADLRLAPLSSKFVESPNIRTPPRTPGESSDPAYARSHSSYLQGKSAPSTPGILTRSGSRKRLSGGLSRRESSFYDDTQDDFNYTYAANRPASGERTEIGSLPKAKSDAFLTQQAQEPGRGHKHKHSNSLHRTTTISSSRDYNHGDESWFTHTSATASALLQEGKGQSWLASRDAATGHNVAESEDDEDEEYEEMAALNASTAKLNLEAGEVHSPTSTRISRWGSRYGSRQGSRMASRMTSPTGTRTPRARRQSEASGYFDSLPASTLAQPLDEQPAFVGRADRVEEEEDNREVARLTSEQTFGLGAVVDKFMNFNLFKADEGETTEDEEAERRNETADEARARMAAENLRKKQEKERLVAVPPAPRGGEDGKGDAAYGWADAAWLLSVASKALF